MSTKEILIKRIKMFYMWAKLRYPTETLDMTTRNCKIFFYLTMLYFILKGKGYNRQEILEYFFDKKYYPVDKHRLAYLIEAYLINEHRIMKPICTIRWGADVELYLMTPQGKIGKDTYIVHLETEKIYPWTTYVYSRTGQKYPVERIKSIDGKHINLSISANANAIYQR